MLLSIENKWNVGKEKNVAKIPLKEYNKKRSFKRGDFSEDSIECGT